MSSESQIISGADSYKRRRYNVSYGEGMEETISRSNPEDRWLLNLFRGVLVQAIKDYKREFAPLKEDASRTYRHNVETFEHVRRSAKMWLFNETDYDISVIDVCDLLGIDYDNLKERLLRPGSLNLEAIQLEEEA